MAFEKIRRLDLARAAILSVLALITVPGAARVSAATAPPSFATAYSVPYSDSVAESISQRSNGGFAVGAVYGNATLLRVDSSGNIQSQMQYSYGNGSQNIALNILKSTSDRGRHLRRATPIRLPSPEPAGLRGNRQSGLDRESSMGQRPAIRHFSLFSAPKDLALRRSTDQ